MTPPQTAAELANSIFVRISGECVVYERNVFENCSVAFGLVKKSVKFVCVPTAAQQTNFTCWIKTIDWRCEAFHADAVAGGWYRRSKMDKICFGLFLSQSICRDRCHCSAMTSFACEAFSILQFIRLFWIQVRFGVHVLIFRAGLPSLSHGL